MRRRQLAYNSQGLRHDGNYKLAKILRSFVDGKRCTVVLAFCGTDGSFLDVPVPMPSESWTNIKKVLCPLLAEIKDVRLERGYSLLDSLPVLHATDTFQRHAPGLRRLYASVWSGLALASEANTPKGHAKRRRILSPENYQTGCTITGEPMHCIINLRKLVSPQCNDARGFIADYSELINRLSTEDAPEPEDPLLDPPSLSEAGRALLLKAVEGSKAELLAACDAARDAAVELSAFIADARVSRAEEWKDLFHAAPPRGVLARIARRLSVELHSDNRPWCWRTKREFRTAIRHLKKWYKPGRRQTRWRLGILRGQGTDHVRGRWSVWTGKVNTHCKGLLGGRKLEGLWLWRFVARGLRAAGVPVHTGTVPCERLWSQLKLYFPAAARNMKRPWWDLLAMLSFMRVNYRHFNHRTMPKFTEGDALLSERIDALVSLTRAFHASAEGDVASLTALEQPLAGS